MKSDEPGNDKGNRIEIFMDHLLLENSVSFLSRRAQPIAVIDI